MKVGLETVVSYFPETIIRREDFAHIDAVTPPAMAKLFKGPDEIRRSKDYNAVEIMGQRVAKKALDKAGLLPSDIDFILAGNLGGKNVVPMVGTKIHHELGFPEETPVVNIQNCCAGFIDACNVAWNLLKAGEYKRVLIVMVTAWATGGWDVDQTSPLAKQFGDGSAAAIVSAQNLKCEFLSYVNKTVGSLYDHLAWDFRRTMHPEFLTGPTAQRSVGMYLWGDEAFLEWAQDKRIAIDCIEKALKKANLKVSELGMIFFHQAQDVFFERWMEGAEEAGVSKDKWKETWNRYGNIGNVEVASNLAEWWEKGQIPKGSIIAFWVPGGGAHIPCMILKWL
jgi:3-oxoacyl-[acyl-carrier-protein] synthase III